MSQTDYIDIQHSCIDTLKTTYGIKYLQLFGSIVRNSYKATSDIDICVDTETANPFILMGIKEFLEQQFGRSVDIIHYH